MATIEDVTQGRRDGGGAGSGTEPEGHDKDRARPRDEPAGSASSQVPLPCSATHRAVALGSWLWGWLRVLGRRLRDCAPYTDRPASIHDVVTYTRAGGWVPGEHPWWVEAPGHVYGWVIAIPVTVALYIVAWVVQRGCRLLCVLGLYILLHLAGFDALNLVYVPWRWLGVM